MNIPAFVELIDGPVQVFQKNPLLPVPFTHDICRHPLTFSHMFTHRSGEWQSSPKRIGVMFSGGPAPGGHDVLCGMLRSLRPEDALIGICGGAGGLLNGQFKALDIDDVDQIEATGGFDWLGTDRTKLSTEDQFNTVRHHVLETRLDALVIIGGDDSNTNALYVSDALYGTCQVIGVPKTIDGDLVMMPYLPIPFGFHSATNHYAELVEQLMVDANATGKYWHLVKLMGRSASHVTLEVALKTHPHACLLSEEVIGSDWSLRDVVDYFSDVVLDRFDSGQVHGVMVVAEGIVDGIKELRALMNGDVFPLNEQMGDLGLDRVRQTSYQRDSHGNINVSMIPLEHILLTLIEATVAQALGDTEKIQFMAHFFGYTGRSVPPTAFDSIYSRLLGKTAVELVYSNLTAVLASLGMVSQSLTPMGIPLHCMLTHDAKKKRHVIQKYMVDMSSIPAQEYIANKDAWRHYPNDFRRWHGTECPKIIDYLNKKGDF